MVELVESVEGVVVDNGVVEGWESRVDVGDVLPVLLGDVVVGTLFVELIVGCCYSYHRITPPSSLYTVPLC